MKHHNIKMNDWVFNYFSPTKCRPYKVPPGSRRHPSSFLWSASSNKCSMHTLEKETHEILRDFEMQTNHLILAKRPIQVIIKKKKRRKFAVF